MTAKLNLIIAKRNVRQKKSNTSCYLIKVKIVERENRIVVSRGRGVRKNRKSMTKGYKLSAIKVNKVKNLI